jgi:uncharacterized protein (TIRG00374 family)
MKRRMWKRLSWRLIGPFVLVAAVWWAGPSRVWAVLAGTRWAFFAAALSLAFPLALGKGTRWRVLLRGYRIHLRFNEAVGMYAMGMTMAGVTPGRLGDFVKVFPLVRRGHGIGRAVFCSIVDRLIDMAFIVLAGCASFFYIAPLLSAPFRTLSLLAAIGIVVLAFSKRWLPLARRAVLRLAPVRHHDAVSEFWSEMVSGSFVWHGRRAATISSLTVGAWGVQCATAFLCAQALNLPVSFLYLSACLAIATVASFLPITVAGVGTRDAVFLGLLQPAGLSRQEILALSSLLLAVFLCNCILFYLISIVFGASKEASVQPVAGDPVDDSYGRVENADRIPSGPEHPEV